ncbi:hypothetical protein [Oceanidesulfovibrio marinus]|uniref:Uncharacterized protein n=1 Tax=Oceanidesulfovibrio marinus TaxID=370038 RepID=A0A6P1ZKK5_9BACT|nr:hypothetical protein [Oceanidesulfovibrio marinus]TVM35624.1 hypothetical protein DQK91_02870 [Oceanidesulfovibrio marinus]
MGEFQLLCSQTGVRWEELKGQLRALTTLAGHNQTIDREDWQRLNGFVEWFIDVGTDHEVFFSGVQNDCMDAFTETLKTALRGGE